MWAPLKKLFRTLIYFFFGFCLYEECAGVSGTTQSTAKCGSVFITISSLRGSHVELNWETNCNSNETKPETVALYNMDIRNEHKDNLVLYAEVKARNHPDGYYKTSTHFNIQKWPEAWKYDAITNNGTDPRSLPYWIVSFSNRNQIIDIKSLKLHPTWMKDNRDKLKFTNIGNLLLPGTHDSGCYGDIKLFEDYVITQNMPIWHQLVFGIRYLDLRIAYHQDKEFYINHDFVKIRKLSSVYDQIREFIERSPLEVIIVDFHRFPFPSKWSRQLHYTFINYTLDELGDYAFSKDDRGLWNDKGPTLEEIWDSKKNIIFTYSEEKYAQEFPELWEPIPQFWANTLSVDSLKTYLADCLNQSSNAMLHALMAELTPRSIDVITGTNTLRELANDVNSNLTKWVRDEWRNKANIVTSDFFLGNNLIEVAIQVNRKR